MKMTMEVNSSYAFARIGQREVHIERHPAASRNGWLSVERGPIGGEVIWNVGRWAVHFVKYARGVGHNAT